MYELERMLPAGDGAVVERRADVRHVAVMRVATLHTMHGEVLCLVRNISEGGLKARIWSRLDIGDPLTTEFKSGHHVRGRVVWQADDHVGIQFNETGNVGAILGGDEDPAPGSHPRAPRVHVERLGRVRSGARYHSIMLRDISQGGAKVLLAPEDRWERGEPSIVLTLAGLPPIEGRLRWHKEEVAGLTFNTPLPLDLLARWVAERRG